MVDRQEWQRQIDLEVYRWRRWPDGCNVCKERIGHFGGDAERPMCYLLPHDLPLQEVRPNCFTIRRHWIGDAIRSACIQRGKP